MRGLDGSRFAKHTHLVYTVRVNETDFGDEAADENRDVFDFVDVEGMLFTTMHSCPHINSALSQTSDLLASPNLTAVCSTHMIACHNFLVQYVFLLWCSRVSFSCNQPCPEALWRSPAQPRQR